MKKLLTVLTVLILVGICIPAVLAEEYSFTYEDSVQHSDIGIASGPSITTGIAIPIDGIKIHNSQSVYGCEIEHLLAQYPASVIANYAALPDNAVTTVELENWATADFGYFKYMVGETPYLHIYVANIEYVGNYPPGYDGEHFVVFNTPPEFIKPTALGRFYAELNVEDSLYMGIGSGQLYKNDKYNAYREDSNGYYAYKSVWRNNLEVLTESSADKISVYRSGYNSNFTVTGSLTTYTDIGNNDYEITVPTIERPYTISIINPVTGKSFLQTVNIDGLIGSTSPTTNNTVTVYIRNSQTGAAIANSNCVIDALVGDEYHPVVNRTEPSGIFIVTLQQTGGGFPNPDGYRLIATADGYNNPMPEINFTVDEYTTSIYCYLDPIAGGPEDENNTFIDFFVRDMSANPISGATVNFGGYTLLTNSHGYTVFEVGKNATYTYTVSKSGYGPLTGDVVIGADSRHTINTVLAPAVTPTTPTPIPTDTPISPTPTMTAPTGEPVSNWLEWFAAHFGMILGGGVEIGKIFMWLCFSVPVGVYVGKEAKAGAAGFMAGAGIVTLFFVLIGWVPIWLVVLLVLIIGLLYAKVFNNSDHGGGR